ncbi:MAG: AAA family ATPase [Limisphaerales bacterium]
MPRLKVENFGPIKSADVHFGDLTVFVGPQASGKSIFLQLLKLLTDQAYIKNEFGRAGVDWQGRFPQFLQVYFGEGMHSLWKPNTRVRLNERNISLPDFVQERRSGRQESMFFVPAQRVLALRDGWPSAFNYYDASVPYTVREFSEQLRLLMSEFGAAGTLFPVARRLKQDFRELLQRHIFPGVQLKIDTQRAQKRLVLASKDGSALPVPVWSAGQREFVPLLLGLYWLMVPGRASRRQGVEWAVLEELEMGLHPRAISVIAMLVFEWIARGYKVCLSTHSPQVLDAIWALRNLRENAASPEMLLEVFAAPKTPELLNIASKALKKHVKVHYFRRDQGSKDISRLDPGAEDQDENEWGGLSEFASRANDLVAAAVSRHELNALPGTG